MILKKLPITRFVIVGSGRSGTSLLSQIFHTNGFASFDWNLHFESWPLVKLNERVLSEGWNDELSRAYEDFFSKLERVCRGCWCIKDPRLSVTIQHLHPIIPSPYKLLMAIRDPTYTIGHLVEIRVKQLGMSREAAIVDAETLWCDRVEAVLRFIEQHPDIDLLLVDYDNLVDGKLYDIINRFVGQRMTYQVINPARRKAVPIKVNDRVLQFHEQLHTLYRATLCNVIFTTNSLPEIDNGPRFWPFRLPRKPQRLFTRIVNRFR